MAQKECKKRKTSIGGQAVIEGVMMRGRTSIATAVRDDSGNITLETSRITPPEKKNKFLKLPIVRGVVSLFDSLVGGTKILMRSATVFGEDETSNFDAWVSKKNNKSSEDLDFAIFLGVLLGVVLSVALFFFLPQKIADLFSFVKKGGFWYSVIEGVIRILIFITYILLTSLMKDVRRTFMYHGAEHKTISAYEHGMELTVENVKKCSRVHDRCGTTFLFIVMTISILVFAIVNSVLVALNLSFEGVLGNLFRFAVKLLCLPIVAGISYEILKALAKTESKAVYFLKVPGLLLQRLTTREPENEMIEVAIAAFNQVLLMDSDETVATQKFTTFGNVVTLLERVKKVFKKNKIDESDAEWLVSIKLGIKRSELTDKSITVTENQVKEIAKLAGERIEGKPLAYVLGNVDFYGYILKVNENVLIPRPETEELCAIAIKNITADDKVLDMCTGSGAIAIAIQKQTNAHVTAVDVSEEALAVAKENAITSGANVEFIASDMFSNVTGIYNVIVSNPPYIKTDDLKNLQSEVKLEPQIALDGGNDGLKFYKILATDGALYLKSGGTLYVEYGIGESNDILKILEDSKNFKNIEIIKDIMGIERIIKAERV